MPSEPLKPGARLGKYKVLAHIATGGMGTVYKATDVELGRLVALKVLDDSMADNPHTLERFRREARHAARLMHKNIVTLYEYKHDKGRHFLALEYVDGIDLYDYIERKGQLAPEESRRILLQAVQALDHAYKQGITHRDIKPSNFLLTRDRDRMRVKLTDMGLARRADEVEDFRVTRAGSTVGTIDYLAPEQARDSSAADIRSDIYSLGCTLYHMLTGNPPFSEGGLGERILKHLQEEPQDVRQLNPRVSAEMWALMQRMLAKNPQDRFQTPAELLKELKALPPQAADSEPLRLPRAASARKPPPSPRESHSGSATVMFPEVPAESSAPARSQPRCVEDDPSLLKLSNENLQTAALQYERAEEARANGNLDYAIELLLNCTKFNPVSIVYRQALRDASRDAAGQRGMGGWLASLTTLTTRSRVNAALRARKYRKVLDDGEEVLVRHPSDAKTQIAMAESAEALGLVHLATWMLQELRRHEPRSLPAHRALASLYERQCQYRDAIAVWEDVRKFAPHDGEAARKIKDLAASDTIARGNYRR
jgi:serine/threonine protein kinase